jgi:hypothetical protein
MEPQGFSSIFEGVNDAGLILFIIVVWTKINILNFVSEHFIDDTSKFVSSGGYGGRSAVFSSYSSIESTKCTISMGKSEGRPDQKNNRTDIESGSIET